MLKEFLCAVQIHPMPAWSDPKVINLTSVPADYTVSDSVPDSERASLPCRVGLVQRRTCPICNIHQVRHVRIDR